MNYHRSGTISDESLDYLAVSDALNFLSERERAAFFAWRQQERDGVGASFRLCGRPVRVLGFADGKLTANGLDLDSRSLAAVQALVLKRQDGVQEQNMLLGADLLVFQDTAIDRSAGSIVTISPKVMARFLRTHFPDARVTPALQRLLTCYIAGLSLTATARLDRKSVETLKTQTRDLKNRLGLDHPDEIARVVGARLTAAIAAMLSGRDTGRNSEFERYVRTYLPDTIRSMVLLDGDGCPYRILDMGPKGGAPLIVLHPLILHDIRAEDVAQLDALNLRLLWPLRNGLNAPDDPTLSEAEQLHHACRGIDLVRRLFCDGRVALLSFAASSKVALAYAKANPADVEVLFFAAACVLEGRPMSGPRRLAKGMLALAGRNEFLMNATLEYFRKAILTPERIPSFLRRQFQASRADSLVIERELAGHFGANRFRDALAGSIPSARHDFGFQGALDWGTARGLALEMHILQGDDDAIHPLPLIERLAESLPGARLHVIRGAGQLLYHEHLRSVLEPVAARLSR